MFIKYHRSTPTIDKAGDVIVTRLYTSLITLHFDVVQELDENSNVCLEITVKTDDKVLINS